MNIRKFFNSTKCRLKSVFLLSKVKCLKLLEELKNSRKYKPIEEIEETKICKLVDKLTSYKKLKEVKRGGYFMLAITVMIFNMHALQWVNTVNLYKDINSELRYYTTFAFNKNLTNGLLNIIFKNHFSPGMGVYSFTHLDPLKNPKPALDIAESYVENAFAVEESNEKPWYRASPIEDYKIWYAFSSASVIPVPTAAFKLHSDTRNSAQATIVNEVLSAHAQGNNKEECEKSLELGHKAYSSCNFTYDLNTNLLRELSEEEVDSGVSSNNNIQFLYTVPALGTGTAYKATRAKPRCDFFSLNQNGYYYNPLIGKPDQLVYIDPLDHPCNWNVMDNRTGETLSIPLFTRDPEDPSKIVYHHPNLLTLRLRFPCLDGDTFCSPEQRIELRLNSPILMPSGRVLSITDPTHLSNDDFYHANAREWQKCYNYDNSDRLLDYAIAKVSNNPARTTLMFRPLDKIYSSTFEAPAQNQNSCVITPVLNSRNKNYYRMFGITGRTTVGVAGDIKNVLEYRSYDFSQFRARFFANSFIVDPSEGQQYPSIFLYDRSNRISNMNLINNITIPDNNDSTLTFLDNQFKNIHYSSGIDAGEDVRLYSTPSSPNPQIYPFKENENRRIEPRLTLFEEGDEIYLQMRLEGYRMYSNPIKSKFYNGVLKTFQPAKMEWQIISDKPLGNTHAVMFGGLRDDYLDQTYDYKNRFKRNLRRFKYIPKGTGNVLHAG